jgi:hypothetical protein
MHRRPVIHPTDTPEPTPLRATTKHHNLAELKSEAQPKLTRGTAYFDLHAAAAQQEHVFTTTQGLKVDRTDFVRQLAERHGRVR